MKKIILMSACAMVMLLFCACGKDNVGGEAKDDKISTTNGQETTEQSQKIESTYSLDSVENKEENTGTYGENEEVSFENIENEKSGETIVESTEESDKDSVYNTEDTGKKIQGSKKDQKANKKSDSGSSEDESKDNNNEENTSEKLENDASSENSKKSYELPEISLD